MRWTVCKPNTAHYASNDNSLNRFLYPGICAKYIANNNLERRKSAARQSIAVIEKQTGYLVVYNKKDIKAAKPVTVTARQQSLDKFLEEILREQDLNFMIEDKTISVKKKKTEVFLSPSLFEEEAPPVEVLGNITNAAGEYLSGVNIVIKRTGRGTTTNAKGNFVLKGVLGDDILVLSMVGYKTQEIPVAGKTDFAIKMEIDVDGLDKVVVQGYGVTSQRLSTGNIATVTAKEIEKQPVINVLSALQGRVPGLVITPSNGYASSSFNVEIRGRTVINHKLNNEPLFVVDGVPLTVLTLSQSNNGYGLSTGLLQNDLAGPAMGQSPLFSLNPADIESVSVLKDADATAIYGSRGANGVILINTKKGKIQKTKIDFNFYSGASIVTGRYKLLNTQQYLEVRNEAFKNDGIQPDVSNAYDLVVFDTTRYTNWQNEFWGETGKTIDAQASISGGDRQTSFRVGTGYHRETSMFTKSGADERMSAQFNIISRSLNQRLQLSMTGIYTYTQSDMMSFSGTDVLLVPNGPAPINPSGYINFDGWQPVPNSISNWGTLFQPYTAKTRFVNSDLSLQYSLLRGLDFSTKIGYSNSNNSQEWIFPIISQDPAFNPTGGSSFGNNNGTNSIVEPQLEYKGLIKSINVNAMVGGSIQSVSQNGNTIHGTGYVNDNLLYSIANAPVKNAGDVWGQYKYSAVFARLNLNFNSKYILNLSYRRDGSSRFGPGKQFGDFGAIGVAYIISEEPWFKRTLSFISFAKMRGSYGFTGSDQIGDCQYLSRWSSNIVFPYNNTPSYASLGLANPELQWQTNRKVEGAIELGLFKDRVLLQISAYQHRCGNQLIYYRLPGQTGFDQIAANWNANVQNAGIEISLNAEFISTKDFEWSFMFNTGANKNKLISFPGIEQTPYAYQYKVGESLNIMKALHLIGVNPQNGQYFYVDKNHDGEYNLNPNDSLNDLFSEDFSVKFDGSFQTSFKYKNLNLNILFNFRSQPLFTDVYRYVPGTIGNQSIAVLDRWQKPGDIARFPRYTTQPVESDNLFGQSDGVWTNVKYIRVRNVSISYDFSETIGKRLKLSSLSIFARGQNLFSFGKYAGIDPEAPYLGVMPPSKTFTTGLQLSL